MSYEAKRDENNDESEKQSLGSRLKENASKAKNFHDSYKANGGLGGMAKNAAMNKINDKKDALKDKAKDKLNDKIPDSVKQKQQQAKDKLDSLKDKANKPKEKAQDMKANLNEKAFKTGVKAAANALAPGTGEVAEKLLDTPLGKDAVDKARAASNPVSAIREGTKELVKKVVNQQTKKKIIFTLAPYLGVFIIVLIIISGVSKFSDSQAYFNGEDEKGLSAIKNEFDEKYVNFYENVEKYSSKYNADKSMIVATLTAYIDNDVYTNIGEYSEDDEEDVDLNVDDQQATNEIEKTSEKYMKKQIKLVAKKISESGSTYEGDYTDRSSGSDYFWWLYDEYVEDYYSDYFTSDMTTESRNEKKEEIIDFIYLYYGAIKSEEYSGSCTEGSGEVRFTTFDDDNLGASVDKSLITSDEKGFKYYNYNGKKYLIVATATNICIDTGCGFTDLSQTTRNFTRYDYIKYYNYFDTLTLTIDGTTYDAMVLDSCGGCQFAKEIRPYDKGLNRIDIWVEPGKSPIKNDFGSFGGSVGCNVGPGLEGADDTGFVIRSGQPDKSNKFYYSKDNYSYAAGFTGQCTWYSFGRANEILANAGSNLKWDIASNARDWYSMNIAKGTSGFKSSNDINAPKRGAIIVWKGGTGGYGHVGVIEAVNSDGTINYSEANVSSAKTNSNPYGFRYNQNVNVSSIKSMYGLEFVGYVYILN